ncbi:MULTISPECIES: hypothetical protein [unclassified Caballeronia]|uniref:hypothetical protein n=1 Tax=unclassified Caballeronia TaxID=2646786 RepID=UPI0028617DB6|nr:MULTISPECIES: hypothetical protein [unclassified Caballeronia]MDR5751364.1 hypothetical protein [Caballeronia sp. LZ024]MDR5844494.1 hypothetical protein [Caballeronia sp. LZ031]
MSTISNQEKGEKAAQLLSDWVKRTPLESMPLNQFGKINRSRICKTFDISPSTVGSNDGIRKVFDELDERLRNSAPMPSRSHPARALRPSVESQGVSPAEADALRRKLARLSYLEEYVIWIPG